MSTKPAISFSASPGPGRSGATVLVVAAVLCQQLGAAVAVLVFPVVGPLGMVALRMGFSAVVLLAMARPRIRNLGPAAWRTAIGLGLVLAAMNSLFFGAIARLPLGTAVTIEVLGPLVLSVVASRRASALLWAVLAFAGVALLGQGGIGTVDATGVGFALGAATCWAAYILLNARAGAAFPGFQGLALAMAIGTVASLPGAVLTTGTALADPTVLAIGLGVALLSTAIPYSLELIALRRIPAATFSVLTCTAPAIAALIGFAVLGQPLGWIEAAAIALVVAASIGAIRTGPRARGGDRPGPRSRHQAHRPPAQDHPFPQP
ncbi:EamA family transporter [Citricoccus nitrophenolicus]|uniref:EamA family transporter n=1 Tax=Citricoccus nitrophenolicus TaxID=863575 RepID=UPI0039B60ED8